MFLPLMSAELFWVLVKDGGEYVDGYVQLIPTESGVSGR